MYTHVMGDSIKHLGLGPFPEVDSERDLLFLSGCRVGYLTGSAIPHHQPHTQTLSLPLRKVPLPEHSVLHHTGGQVLSSMKRYLVIRR